MTKDKEKELPLVGATKCYICYERLTFTDNDYADDIIEKHITREHINDK